MFTLVKKYIRFTELLADMCGVDDDEYDDTSFTLETITYIINNMNEWYDTETLKELQCYDEYLELKELVKEMN